MLVASIPSPHTGVLNVGPLHIHLYGLTLLVAILACVWLTTRRWKRQGGDPDLVIRVAVWGGILLGTLAGWVVVRRAGVRFAPFMDAAAPGLLLAQGIGRIGNWWNQELFGKPTSLPWGLKIDAAHRPVQYIDKATFHPTFLYELIWDVAGVLLLLWVARRFRIKSPGLFCLYVAYYCFGRFFEELLRVDPAHHFAGLRLNAWVSIVVFIGAVVAFVWVQRRGREVEPRRPRRAAPPPGPKMAVPRRRVR